MPVMLTDLSALLVVDTQLLLQPEMLVRIALQFGLFILSAFFSGSETALFSLSHLDMQELRRGRHPQFGKLQALLERPRQLIISILCGNELINVAATANMAAILVTLYGVEVGGVMNMFVMVPLLLLFGEVTPKTIAVTDPVKISTRVVATPLTVWVKLVAPFRWLVRLISDQLTTWIVGEEKTAENILQIDEFRTLVDEVAKGGELTASERSLIYNLLDAGSTEVVEIMIPRSQMAFVDAKTPMPEVVAQLRELKRTRIPVFSGSRDELVGFIHAEDILQRVLVDTDFSALPIEQFLHPPLLVPPTKKVDELLDFFLSHRSQVAAVMNEFGGIDGMITLKRVLAFVFGPITPESSLRPYYVELAENVYEMTGDMKLTDFNNLTNFSLEDMRMTTIGGVLLRALDRWPRVGDQVAVEGVELTVLEMVGQRITRLRATKGGGDPRSSRRVPPGDGEEGL